MISGVPQGTVLGPLLFIILMCDINSGITSSSMVSFADDTRLDYGISNVDDCAILQNDLNYVYEWASDNNMFFMPKNSNIYIFIIFDFHIYNRYKRCSNLAGWILRTFTMRVPQV